jgi:ankyrin repeat protein
MKQNYFSIHLGKVLLFSCALTLCNIGYSEDKPTDLTYEINRFREAVGKDDLKTIRDLLKNYPGLATVMVQDGNYRQTLLFQAAAKKLPGSKAALVEAATELLANKADINAKRSRDGETPLYAAVESEFQEMAQLLLANKADVNSKNKDGYTALQRALNFSNLEIARLLVANKADVTFTNDDGNTPLHFICDSRNSPHFKPDAIIEFAGSLLANNADINAENKDGNTALHLSISRLPVNSGESAKLNLIQKVQFLLNHKANVNAKNKKGATPLDKAKKCDLVDIVELMRKQGGQQ